MADSKHSSFALIGMSCRFPGDASSPQKLWNVLSDGKDTWRPVPRDRFNEDAFFHPSPEDPNGTSNHKGGHFLDQDISRFDHEFFKISPHQASAMDPQQRVSLEVVFDALEDAGLPKETMRGSSTAVYMATFSRDYDRVLYQDPLSIPTYQTTGTGDAILANRISHSFDLRGPSVTLDTGCSGGLVALHHACQSLQTHEVDFAIAGAVNLIIGPTQQIGMSYLHMLNPNGRSYPFDELGNGYGRGEGVAAVIIKRLQDAISAQDPIRAVILSTAVNQDGYTSSGITRPSAKAQAELEQMALRRAGIRAADVGYVETHGTGTVSGDLAEMEALGKIFHGQRSVPLYVGSIKGNLGHLESSSGLAGLIKVVLSLEYGKIPPTINYNQAKRGLETEKHGIHISVDMMEWPSQATRIAGVNSFGYGGTNAHVILHAAPSLQPETKPLPSAGALSRCRTGSVYLFLLSAASKESLTARLRAYNAWLSEFQKDIALSDLSFTLCCRRSQLRWRFSCVASSRDQLQDQVRLGLRSSLQDPTTPKNQLVWVFTGQGAQWAGMGRELLLTDACPPFKISILTSRDMIFEMGATWDLIEELTQPDDSSRLGMAEFAQPCTTAIQIALVDLFRSMGVVPHAVVGHSSGEVAAAYASDYLSHHDALRIAFSRGMIPALIRSKGIPSGTMLAVGIGEGDVSSYLKTAETGLVNVACSNSPISTTISGDSIAIDEIQEVLNADGVFNRRLKVDVAYHSYHMQAIGSEYKMLLGSISPKHSMKQIRFFSSVTGSEKEHGFEVKYWVQNLRSKVRFLDALQTCCRSLAGEYQRSSQVITFLEIGPHSALAGPIRQCVSALPTRTLSNYLSTLKRGENALITALKASGGLFEAGFRLDFRHLYPSSLGPKVLNDQPAYCWDHQERHWSESRLSRQYRLRQDPYHDLLGVRTVESTTLEPRWRYMLSLATNPWLSDHVIDGLPLFPGSGYLCMAIEGARQLAEDGFPGRSIAAVRLRDVQFLRALVVPELPHRKELQMSFSPRMDHTDNGFRHKFLVSAESETGIWIQHCHGIVEIDFITSLDRNLLPWPASNTDAIMLPEPTAKTAEHVCSELRTIGNIYGPAFTGIQSFNSTKERAVAQVCIPDVIHTMPHRFLQPHFIHPTALDIIMHTSLPLASENLFSSGSIMPVSVAEICIWPQGFYAFSGMSFPVSIHLFTNDSRSAVVDLSTQSIDDLAPQLSIVGLKMLCLASKHSSKTIQKPERDICFEMKYGLDVDLLSKASICNPRDTLPLETYQTQISIGQVGQFYIRHYTLQIMSDIEPELQRPFLALRKHLELAVLEESRAVDGDISTHNENELFNIARGVLDEHPLLSQMKPYLISVLAEAIHARERMLQDKDLYQLCSGSFLSCCSSLYQYVQHCCFKTPEVSVLDVGAMTTGLTSFILETLKNKGWKSIRYDLTATSEASLEHAKQFLTQFKNIDFRTLNPWDDPLVQGFRASKYDIIIADTALCSSADGATVLSNMHRLMKPNGSLLLIEMAAITRSTTGPRFEDVVRGAYHSRLPGLDSWKRKLKECGFELQLSSSSNEAEAHDIVRLLVARGTKPWTTDTSFEMVYQAGSSTLVKQFSERLSNTIHFLGSSGSSYINSRNSASCNSVKVVIDDVSSPLLEHLSQEEYRELRNMLSSPARIMWVSLSCDERRNGDIARHLITGVSRTAHMENEALQLVTVDMTLKDNAEQAEALERLAQCFYKSFATEKSEDKEREFVYRNNDMMIPRLFPSETMNLAIQGNVSHHSLADFLRPLRLESEPNDPPKQSLFKESGNIALMEDEVEIELKALGVSTFDLSSAYYECAGLVTALGSGVTHLFIGCQVFALVPQFSSSRPRVDSAFVCPLPKWVSFRFAAAMSLEIAKAIYAFQDLANLQPNQTVFVQGAMNSAGQAATTVAKFYQARVFASVETSEDVNDMHSLFGISREQILLSQDLSSTQNLNRRFGTDGIAVLLNCSENDTSFLAARHVNPFGHIITYQKARTSNEWLVSGGNLPANITLHVCDFTALWSTQISWTKDLLRRTMRLLHEDLPFPSLSIKTLLVEDYKAAVGSAEGMSDSKVVLLSKGDDFLPISRGPNPNPLFTDGSYLIAGGLGDLGRRLLRLMARKGARNLVTLSRTIPEGNKLEAFRKEVLSEGQDCRLYCLECDIAKKTEVKKIPTEIEAAGLPPVVGVIQAAVKLQDHTIASMTLEDFEAPLAAKLHGTRNLEEVFGNTNLEFFISLSSAVNIIGSGGQANYNAGNSVQDGLAFRERTDRCHYVSLNLGFIEDADAMSEDASRKAALERQGLVAVKADELEYFFIATFDCLRRGVMPAQAIIGFDSESLLRSSAVNATVRSPLFTHIRRRRENSGSMHSNSTANGTGTDKSALLDLTDPTAYVAQAIGAKIANMTASSAKIVNLDQPTFEFGVDSLMAIELRSWIMHTLGAPLQTSELLDHSSINILAQKIVDRLRKRMETEVGVEKEKDLSSTLPLPKDIEPISRTSNKLPILPELPVPTLKNALDMLMQSRRAVGTETESKDLRILVDEFCNGVGRQLQQRLEGSHTGSEMQATIHERVLSLSSRRPVWQHSTYFLGHLVEENSPHSQAERAAILTIAAMRFRDEVSDGRIMNDSLGDQLLDTDNQNWLFHTSRIPKIRGDVLERTPITQTIVVMRRGHIFSLNLNASCDEPQVILHVKHAFEEIQMLSEQSIPAAAALTADDRHTWANIRQGLRTFSLDNERILDIIAGAAFVICLDDALPITPSDRCNTFLFNDREMNNRWWDKSLQFVVAANGCSATIGENTKADGITHRLLMKALQEAIFQQPTELLRTATHTKSQSIAAVEELQLRLTNSDQKRVEYIQELSLRTIAPVEYRDTHVEGFRQKRLLTAHSPRKAAAMILLLLTLAICRGKGEDKKSQPVWETVSLAPFRSGRIDWIQVVSQPVWDFVRAATQPDPKPAQHAILRELWQAAVADHTRTMGLASRGHGFVNHLYSLKLQLRDGEPVPALFESMSWKATERGGLQQSLKTDCLPPGESAYGRWQEAGFMMHGFEAYLVHYHWEEEALFVSVQTEVGLGDRFMEALARAEKIVCEVLELQRAGANAAE